MKERPIIFSTESVRAILDGRKTQTRRVKNPQPLSYCGFKYGIDEDGEWYELHHYDNPQHPMVERIYPAKKLCPFGVRGDRLWVRETYVVRQLRTIPSLNKKVFYKADSHWSCDKLKGTLVPLNESRNPSYCLHAWKSPLFMPRKFSRLTLEITDVRCERLCEISWNDCIQEGTFQFHGYIDEHGIRSEGKRLFAEMWNTTNTKRGFSWESNPWVWVIEFGRVEEDNE